MKKILILLFILFLIIDSFCVGYMLNKKGCLAQKDNYKHRIDVEEENCIKNSDVTEYIVCAEKATSAWDREINEKLLTLKKVMPADEYNKIEIMHKEWEKSVYNQIEIINRFITTKDGIIYQCEGQNNITSLKKQYAMLLTSILENYNEG